MKSSRNCLLMMQSRDIGKREQKLPLHDGMGGDEHVLVRYGVECLFRYYSYGLEMKFRKEVFDDFQEQTLLDCKNGQPPSRVDICSVLTSNCRSTIRVGEVLGVPQVLQRKTCFCGCRVKRGTAEIQHSR